SSFLMWNAFFAAGALIRLYAFSYKVSAASRIAGLDSIFDCQVSSGCSTFIRRWNRSRCTPPRSVTPRTVNSAPEGAPGLTMWLMPPWSQSRMHDTSFPEAEDEDEDAAFARARSHSGSPSPSAVSDPTRRKFRRVTPSQLRLEPLTSSNIGPPDRIGWDSSRA